MLLLVLLAAVPSADAQRAWQDGVEKVRAGDSWAARVSFTRAIELSPGSARFRYSRAAAEAPAFGISGCKGSNDKSEPACAPESTLIDDLTWLKEHAPTDPEAKKLLAAVLTDLAFDHVVGEVLPRLALGLPALASMKAVDRLLERQGRWVSYAVVPSPELTLSFTKKGGVRLRIREPDLTGPALGPPIFATGTWKVLSDGQLELRLKPADSDPEHRIPEVTRVEFNAERQSFMLRNAAGEDRVVSDYWNTTRP